MINIPAKLISTDTQGEKRYPVVISRMMSGKNTVILLKAYNINITIAAAKEFSGLCSIRFCTETSGPVMTHAVNRKRHMAGITNRNIFNKMPLFLLFNNTTSNYRKLHVIYCHITRNVQLKGDKSILPAVRLTGVKLGIEVESEIVKFFPFSCILVERIVSAYRE